MCLQLELLMVIYITMRVLVLPAQWYNITKPQTPRSARLEQESETFLCMNCMMYFSVGTESNKNL